MIDTSAGVLDAHTRPLDGPLVSASKGMKQKEK